MGKCLEDAGGDAVCSLTNIYYLVKTLLILTDIHMFDNIHVNLIDGSA